MDNRKSIAARVRALLAKTAENGATEAEALSAALKARELMDKYHIEHGELGMQAEGTHTASASRDHYKTLQLKDRIGEAIAAFCDCKVWRSNDKVLYFGLQSDADFASWLTDSLDAYIRRSVAEYIHGQPWMPAPARWKAEKGFILGVVTRINARLRTLTEERLKAMRGGDGRSLVLMKSSLVNREFARLNMKLGSSGTRRTAIHDDSAFNSGKAAGDRASFGRPVSGDGSGQKLIGQ